MLSILTDTSIYPQLFANVYGEEDGFSANYYCALMEKGILRRDARPFEKECDVWSEALKALGDALVSRNMSREDFMDVVRKHIDQFRAGTLVREWFATSVAR